MASVDFFYSHMVWSIDVKDSTFISLMVAMDKKETPNYYAIIPAPVRYAKDLSEFQKLLYAEITALSQKDGFCYASNNYFSELYGKGKDWISKCINKMASLGYFKIEQEKGKKRKIFIGELVRIRKSIKAPIGEKSNSSIGEKSNTTIAQKSNTPIGEKSNIIIQDNNTTSRIGVNEENPPTPTQRNIEYINGMRGVEIKGKQYLWIRKEITGDEAIMSSEVKKGIYNIQSSIIPDDFKTRVEKFQVIKELIVNKKMQNYFYYPIWTRTLENFLEHINKFYGEDSIIVSRIAKKEEVKKALRVLNPTTTQEEVKQPEEKKQMSAEDKARNIALLRAAKDKFLSKHL